MALSIFGSFKKFQFKKAIYPFIFVVFIIIILMFFVITIKFLYRNINKALTPDERLTESQLIKVDLDNFYFVSKKLGIDLNDKAKEQKTESSVEPTGSEENTITNKND